MQELDRRGEPLDWQVEVARRFRRTCRKLGKTPGIVQTLLLAAWLSKVELAIEVYAARKARKLRRRLEQMGMKVNTAKKGSEKKPAPKAAPAKASKKAKEVEEEEDEELDLSDDDDEEEEEAPPPKKSKKAAEKPAPAKKGKKAAPPPEEDEEEEDESEDLDEILGDEDASDEDVEGVSEEDVDEALEGESLEGISGEAIEALVEKVEEGFTTVIQALNDISTRLGTFDKKQDQIITTLSSGFKKLEEVGTLTSVASSASKAKEQAPSGGVDPKLKKALADKFGSFEPGKYKLESVLKVCAKASGFPVAEVDKAVRALKWPIKKKDDGTEVLVIS